ncbi:MAG: hypothetical protein HYX55_03330 [Chloroflexi bacterium]|nr:hypothetical protein [Chloroflexota bacterium]
MQRLVAGLPTVQREPVPPPQAGAEKTPVNGKGPVGGAGGPLPPGSKVEVKPPATPPAPEAGGEEEEEKAIEFHAEVSGSATATRVGEEPTEGKGAGTIEGGLELPKARLWESTPGKPGGARWRLLTNPEFHVALGGEIEKGKVSPGLRAEVGIDIVRLTVGPWAYRLAAVGGEYATDEGLTAKVGGGVEKELPKTSGFGFKGEAAAGLGAKGPSGEAAARLIYSPQAEGGPVRLYFFGEVKGSVAKDGSDVEMAGTGTLGGGIKF